ncbi:transmembrane protein, putative [Medicago truncatula]|uniref:Transmembrane protein, putative n=1 Tax=Medicago truncatula TaxID=3880 RepID=A0A072U801_MEDTR|nr:transmembrane protein, putative [Medicago truncatula]
MARDGIVLSAVLLCYEGIFGMILLKEKRCLCFLNWACQKNNNDIDKEFQDLEAQDEEI